MLSARFVLFLSQRRRSAEPDYHSALPPRRRWAAASPERKAHPRPVSSCDETLGILNVYWLREFQTCSPPQSPQHGQPGRDDALHGNGVRCVPHLNDLGLRRQDFARLTLFPTLSLGLADESRENYRDAICSVMRQLLRKCRL